MRPWEWLVSREGRKWLYTVSVVAIPLLVAYGALDPKQAPLWLSLLAAVLGIAAPSMALANLTPDKGPEDIGIPDDLDNGVDLDTE